MSKCACAQFLYIATVSTRRATMLSILRSAPLLHTPAAASSVAWALRLAPRLVPFASTMLLSTSVPAGVKDSMKITAGGNDADPSTLKGLYALQPKQLDPQALAEQQEIEFFKQYDAGELEIGEPLSLRTQAYLEIARAAGVDAMRASVVSTQGALVQTPSALYGGLACAALLTLPSSYSGDMASLSHIMWNLTFVSISFTGLFSMWGGNMYKSFAGGLLLLPPRGAGPLEYMHEHGKNLDFAVVACALGEACLWGAVNFHTWHLYLSPGVIDVDLKAALFVSAVTGAALASQSDRWRRHLATVRECIERTTARGGRGGD